MNTTTQKYFKLPHKALGNARLVNFDINSLLVSNIGRTGYDGLTIGLDNIEFWEGSFSFAPMDRRLADSSVIISLTGNISNIKKACLFNIQYYLGGNSMVVTVDNSGLKPQRQTVQMLLGKEVISEVILQETAFAIDLPPVEVIKSSFQGGCKFEFWKKNRKVEQTFRFRQKISISVANNKTVEADGIAIIPYHKDTDVEQFIQLEARAKNVRAILIFNENTTMP